MNSPTLTSPKDTGSAGLPGLVEEVDSGAQVEDRHPVFAGSACSCGRRHSWTSGELDIAEIEAVSGEVVEKPAGDLRGVGDMAAVLLRPR